VKDSQTPDLFVPAPKFIAPSDMAIEPIIQPSIIDTQFITDIYMQRPISIQNLRMGAWFNSALILNDKTFAGFVSTSEVKRYIVQMGYNRLPDLLNKLTTFNKSWTDK